VKKTLFAGLTVLEAGESLDADNGAFTGRDRETTDRFLRIGAKTHRHTGAAGLTNPSGAPAASVIASGGALAAGLSISVGYTLEDADGGETMLSPVTVVSTPRPVSEPNAAPSASAGYTGGQLPVNTYFYAATFTDGEGGETPMGPAVSAERQPGFASGQIRISQLTNGLLAAGATGWRLYRATGGGSYSLLATGNSTEDIFIDDGTAAINCDVHPPAGEENTTVGISTLLVTLPSGSVGQTFINLYASTTGDFGGAALLGQYPLSSAGHVAAFPALEFFDVSPPPVNLSIGGAHQIDPDSELLDWHWRRPVLSSAALGSGTLGDVKLVEGTGQLYAVLSPSAFASGASEWVRIASAGGGSGSVGPQGPEGPAGPTGPTGPTGASGASGAIGLTGPIGPEGPPGPKGASGASGAIGLTGPQGPQGASGASGAIGLTGPQGASGASGAIGLTGPQGPQGASGASGAIGLTGPEGRWASLRYEYRSNIEETEPGAGILKFNKLPASIAEATKLFISETDKDGGAIAAYLATFDDSTSEPRGTIVVRKIGTPAVFAIFKATGVLTDKGTWDTLVIEHVAHGGAFVSLDLVSVEFYRTGDMGASGAIGLTGPQGIEGPVGPKGASGASGAIGLTGPQGPMGASGASGAIGLTGPQGASGASGAIGLTGPQGIQGEKGEKGATGSQGEKGVKGDTGAEGPKGSTGETGSTGGIGPQGPGASWKPPVNASGSLGSGVLGDVKMAEQDGELYGVLSASAGAASAWTRLASGTHLKEGESIQWFSSAGVTLEAQLSASALAINKHEVRLALPQPAPASGFSFRALIESATGGSGSIGLTGPAGDMSLIDQAGRSHWMQLGNSDSNAKDYGLVGSLPVGAPLGSRCIFQVTASVFWHLINDGVQPFPWKKIGGPPLEEQSDTARELTNKVAYESLPSDPLTIEVPLKGDYDITIQGQMILPATVNSAGLHSYAIGAVVASDNWAAVLQNPTATGFLVASVVSTKRQLKLVASDKVIEKARTSGNFKVEWKLRRLIVDPVRVG